MSLLYHTPLDVAQQQAMGIVPPASLAMADQVRFSELDALKHVNNAVYMSWFERVRVRYTQVCGLTRYASDGSDPRIVIRSGTIHYKQEMRMDEDYVVTCSCTAYRTTSFSLRQELWSGGTQRATLDCVLVLLAQDGTGRFPIPDAVIRHFVEIDGAQPDT
jgi:acyl-CoA thioester hydrolase